MNLSTIIFENFGSILATFGTLTGVCLGSVFTWKIQENTFKKQREWNQQKREVEKLEELTMIYNRLLMVDGEKEVIDYNQGRGMEFQFIIYQKDIRPILYEKFHLLQSEVADIVIEIDNVLLKWLIIEEEGYEGESEYIACLYLNLIDKINSYINTLRIR